MRFKEELTMADAAHDVEGTERVRKVIENTQKKNDVERSVFFRREIVDILLEEANLRAQKVCGHAKPGCRRRREIDRGYLCSSLLELEGEKPVASSDVQDRQA